MAFKFKPIFFTSITFVIGVLIGAGFTKNKYVAWTLLTYIIFMIGFRLLGNKLKNIKNAEDKKLAARNEGVKVWNSFVDQTEYGHEKGQNLFDKYYPTYTMYVNVILFVSMFVLMFFKLWIWSLVCYIGLHCFMVLNQIYRNVKPKQEYETAEVVEDNDE